MVPINHDNNMDGEKIKKEYPAFEYPFQNADQAMLELEEMERKQIFYAANVFAKRALAQEVKGLVKHFADQIIYKLPNLEQIAAYRVALDFIKLFEGRVLYLAGMHEEEVKKDNKQQDPLQNI